MANRYCNLNGANKIKDEYGLINDGFDAVEQEMDAIINPVTRVLMGTSVNVTITAPDPSDPPSAYPSGISHASVSTDDGYPHNGTLVTVNMSSTRCFQILVHAGGAIAARLMRYRSYHTSSGWSDWRIGGGIAGTGSPEGSVTAPVGTIYHREDGGASTTLYVKESGTGNTGWKAVQTA